LRLRHAWLLGPQARVHDRDCGLDVDHIAGPQRRVTQNVLAAELQDAPVLAFVELVGHRVAVRDVARGDLHDPRDLHSHA
jgi:hypothetical protein